jgi:hypothetical protein
MGAVVGWDVETHLIEPGNLTPKLVVATFSGSSDTYHLVSKWHTAASPVVGKDYYFYLADDTKEWYLALAPEQACEFMLDLVDALTSGDIGTLVAHNGAFDWAVMCNEVPEFLPFYTAMVEQGLVADTMVREMLLCIEQDNFVMDGRTGRPTSFTLDALVNAYFRKDISHSKKDPYSWRLRYAELDGVALDEWPQRALDYAVEDAMWARRVYLRQADGPVTNEVEQTAAAWVLHLMACHGVYTDADAVHRFEVEVTRAATEANQAARDAGFWKVNKCKYCEGTGRVLQGFGSSPCSICGGRDHEACKSAGVYRSRAAHKEGKHMARLRRLVTDAYGGYPETTDTGNVKTDADTLLGSGNPLLVKYAEGAAAQKLLSTYLPILQRGIDAPITSSPRVLVRSGRTSWRNPNFQNPPQRGGFRDCFIPRPGTVFASIDYSGLEMTTLAQVCLHFFGHSAIGDAINEGKDLHTLFAGYMLAKELLRAQRHRRCHQRRQGPAYPVRRVHAGEGGQPQDLRAVERHPKGPHPRRVRTHQGPSAARQGHQLWMPRRAWGCIACDLCTGLRRGAFL